MTVCTKRTRACGQRVEARARHGVAGEYHRCALEFDPESDGRLDWPVIGRSRGDPHAVAGPHHALGYLFHLDGGWLGDVGMMADPIADVRGRARSSVASTTAAVPGGPMTRAECG